MASITKNKQVLALFRDNPNLEDCILDVEGIRGWITHLRSGTFQQGSGNMFELLFGVDPGEVPVAGPGTCQFCCLGVLAYTTNPSLCEFEYDGCDYLSYFNHSDPSTSELPGEDWPLTQDLADLLSSVNDATFIAGHDIAYDPTFNDIADILTAMLEDPYFVKGT